MGGLLTVRKKSRTPIDVAFLYDGNVTQLVDLNKTKSDSVKPERAYSA
jgi:uncharacterized membrane protein (UPF0127 family)